MAADHDEIGLELGGEIRNFLLGNSVANVGMGLDVAERSHDQLGEPGLESEHVVLAARDGNQVDLRTLVTCRLIEGVLEHGYGSLGAIDGGDDAVVPGHVGEQVHRVCRGPGGTNIANVDGEVTRAQSKSHSRGG